MRNEMLFSGIMFILLMAVLPTADAIEVTINNYDPLPAEAGKLVNVWFKVENTNSYKTVELYIDVVPKDGLELSVGEDTRKRVGYLNPTSSQLFQYRLRVRDDATEGLNLVEAHIVEGEITVKNDLFIEVVEKDVKGVNLEVSVIESDPVKIKPDDHDVKLGITLMNLGDGRAQAVKAELTGLPEGVTTSQSYSGIYLLGNIDADSQSVATFYIDVDESVKPGDYVSQLKLNYKYKPDEGEDDFLLEEEIVQFVLSVKPTPLFNITDVTFEPTELSAGDQNVKLRLTIMNVGEEEGESVRVRIFPKSEQPFIFDDAGDFVAPVLEPGESGQATVQFDVESDADLKTYYLDMEIKNIVGDDVITFREKIPVEISSAKRDDSVVFILVGAVVLIIFLAFFFGRKYMKKRKKTRTGKAQHHYAGSYLEKMSSERKKK